MESPVAHASPAVDERLAPSGVDHASAEPRTCRHDSLAAIGSRPSPLHVVRATGTAAHSKLLVAEVFPGAARPGDAVAARFVADARRISTLANANLARVRELAVRGDNLVVFSDFIDGETLSGFWLSCAAPLEVTVRLILDVLAGVGALHALRDAKQQPMKLAHGEVSPATIVLGLDGIARVLHAVGRCVPGAPIDPASAPYLAPEVQAGGAYDARADVYGAGVLLREALTGRQRPGERSTPGDMPALAPWARGLGAVAAKSLAPLPDDRWPTAAVMAAEIRKVVGLRLASAAVAATFAKRTFGDRVKARRDRLESALTGGPRSPAKWPAPEAAPTTAASSTRRWAEDDTDVSLVTDSLPPGAGQVPESIDPVADTVLLVPSPPRLPTRTHLGSAPPLAATIVDVPVSVGPPPGAGSMPAEHNASIRPVDPAVRRRRAIVLGSVGALGLIVFALAGLRAAYRSTDGSRGATVAPDSPAASASARLPAPPAPSASAATPPAVAAAAVAPPATSHAPRPPPASFPERRPNVASPRAPGRPPPPPAPRPRPPRSRAGFDPASL